MERNKTRDERKSYFDRSLKILLLYWQTDSESLEMAERINRTIENAASEGRGLSIKIKSEALHTSEGRTAISLNNLNKYSRLEDDTFIFNFKPRKSPEGNLRVGIKDLWTYKEDRGIVDRLNLVIEANTSEGWFTFAVFRASEIDSISIR